MWSPVRVTNGHEASVRLRCQARLLTPRNATPLLHRRVWSALCHAPQQRVCTGLRICITKSYPDASRGGYAPAADWHRAQAVRTRQRGSCGSYRGVNETGPARRCRRGGAQRDGNHRAAASALSSGRVLKAMAAAGAPLWMALITASKSTRPLGGRRTPAPTTTQL
jgi:hypothetical protein